MCLRCFKLDFRLAERNFGYNFYITFHKEMYYRNVTWHPYGNFSLSEDRIEKGAVQQRKENLTINPSYSLFFQSISIILRNCPNAKKKKEEKECSKLSRKYETRSQILNQSHTQTDSLITRSKQCSRPDRHCIFLYISSAGSLTRCLSLSSPIPFILPQMCRKSR